MAHESLCFGGAPATSQRLAPSVVNLTCVFCLAGRPGNLASGQARGWGSGWAAAVPPCPRTACRRPWAGVALGVHGRGDLSRQHWLAGWDTGPPVEALWTGAPLEGDPQAIP